MPKKRAPASGHQADVRPEFILLGFLMLRSMHGYDLYSHYQQNLGRVWHMSQSQMYGIIKRLEAQGLIEGLGGGTGGTGGNPSRRYLSITREGLQRFLGWMMQPSDCSSRVMRLEFISRLFFASMQDPSIVAVIVQDQMARVEHELANHDRILREITSGADGGGGPGAAGSSPPDAFNRLALEFRIRQLRAQADWLRECVLPLVPQAGVAPNGGPPPGS